jgi:hypothetical protein
MSPDGTLALSILTYSLFTIPWRWKLLSIKIGFFGILRKNETCNN